MVKYKMLVVFLLVALMVGCAQLGMPITGSGNVVTQEEAISGFDKVEISSAFQVVMIQGETYSVVIRIDDNLLKYLEVVKQGSTLKIGLKTDRTVGATQEAEVTMPALAGLDLSGASRATITGFKSPASLDVDLRGASHLGGDIEAGDARFDVVGASEVTLGGSAGDVDIGASGASTVDLADFPVTDAKVVADGASTVTMNASGTLDVDADGAAHVYYLGSPTLGTIQESGRAEVGPK